jgi:hypothetical protein
MAEYFIRGVLTVMAVVMVAVCGEVAIRVYHWVSEGIPASEWHRFLIGNFDATSLDDQLGWRATENYRARRNEYTQKGKPYAVDLSQNEYGFRRFGDISSRRTKALIIGDSFTHGREVSDAETYYSRLEKLLDFEVFAYGVENYGTLQEYMILDRYFDLIKPDLVVWQYCFNDFANNDPDLEGRTSLHIDFRQRPYWVDGVIVQTIPGSAWAGVRRFAYRYSRFLVFLFGRTDRLNRKFVLNSVESEIEKDGGHHPGFRRSIMRTHALMGLVRQRVGTVPIVAFNCKAVEPYNTVLKDISWEHGIVFLDEVAAAVDAAASRGEDVFHADGAHWSEEGHRVVGEALAKYLNVLISEGKLLVPSGAAR